MRQKLAPWRFKEHIRHKEVNSIKRYIRNVELETSEYIWILEKEKKVGKYLKSQCQNLTELGEM